MAWLRRDKDLIALFVSWAILIQAAIFSFASGLQAATLTSGLGETSILCTSRGTVPGRQMPGPSHQGDCQCCSLACRSSCGGSCSGIPPISLRVPLPGTFASAPRILRSPEPLIQAAWHLPAQPRAPPHVL